MRIAGEHGVSSKIIESFVAQVENDFLQRLMLIRMFEGGNHRMIPLFRNMSCTILQTVVDSILWYLEIQNWIQPTL